MSVARCREINAQLRAAGVVVHEWAGWESRGNGQSSAYEGGIVHHTATAFGSAPSILVNGRTDLPGPLANYSGNEDGSLTVIAAHPANHAGASGGRSMGPLPVTSTFNRRVLGLEIVYPGTVPMRTAQYRSALIWARVVADVVGGGDIERIRAHAETSVTGKWDPGDAPGRTINMAAFRAAARIQPEEDMTPEERNMLKFVHDRVAGIMPQRYWVRDPDDPTGLRILEVGPSHPGAQPATLLDTIAGNYIVHQLLPLADDEAKIIAAIRALPAPGDVDESALAAALAPILAPHISAGATPEQVDSIVRGIFARAGTEGN